MTFLHHQGAFIVDQEYSPLWRAANSHSRRSGNRVFVANRYVSEYALIRDILRVPTSYLIFTWRGAFDSVLQSKRARQLLRNSNVSIYLLIPDLIGIHHISEEEQNRINYADGLIVTSQELLNKYRDSYELKSIQILHDIPPLDAFEDISKDRPVRSNHKIIWVGNSKWGERAGFDDHKGLNGFALPLFEELKKKHSGLSLTVIDSASKKLSYELVLHEIASASCLIFTSKSEGTGLPLIEAALLGTPVVSFDVGIASELLQGELAILISSQNIQEFSEKVTFVLENSEELSEKISVASEAYVTRILDDFECLTLDEVGVGSWRHQRQARNLINILKWKLRWMRYLRSKEDAK